MTKNETTYYLLDSDLGEHSALISESPGYYLEDPFDDAWIEGVKWDEQVPEPIIYGFKAGHMHPYYSEGQPLMSEKLLDALARCGVDNIDTYRAIIHQEGEPHPITNYRTVNIIGIISAVDEDTSEATGLGINTGSSSPRFFTKLKVSTEKARGLLLFRLEERASLIVIHRTVKETLEKEFPDLVFEAV